MGRFRRFAFCQFTTIGGRVDVKPSDFGLAANLDPLSGFSILSVLLFQYESHCPKDPIDTSLGAVHTGYTAKALNKKWMDSLCEEPSVVRKYHNFVQKVLGHYPVGKGPRVEEAFSKCVDARTRLFSDCGRNLLGIGGAIYDAQTKKRFAQETFFPS